MEVKMIENTQVKKKTEYLIRNVAQTVGLSRDALRFYEEKGVISARKEDNGYRYYSEKDMYKLMYILYQRKMSTNPEEIEGLMNDRCSMESRRSHLWERMVEEEHNVRIHQQVTTKLELVEKDMTHIEEYLNRCSLGKFPSVYIMGNCGNPQEELKEWLRLFSTIAGLNMTYFYSMLTYTDRGPVVQGTRLLLYKGLEPDLGEKFSAGRYPMTEEKLCLCTVLESGTPLPSFEMIQRVVQWGHKYGIETEGLVYANDITSFFAEEGAVYYLEVYMPARRIPSRM